MSAMYGHADDDWLMRAHGDIDQWAAVMDVDADDRPIDWNWVRTLDFVHGVGVAKRHVVLLSDLAGKHCADAKGNITIGHWERQIAAGIDAGVGGLQGAFSFRVEKQACQVPQMTPLDLLLRKVEQINGGGQFEWDFVCHIVKPLSSLAAVRRVPPRSRLCPPGSASSKNRGGDHLQRGERVPESAAPAARAETLPSLSHRHQ